MAETDGFDEFFRATWPRLFRTACAVAGDAASAEDALQQAYARAYASWRRVSAAEHPEAYVRRIVVNEILGTRRRAWWRRERPTDLSGETGPATAVVSPEAAIVERDRLWRAVLELPPRQRAVVVLRYYEDLSEEEIAGTLGCSRGTVKSQASAALAKLRQHAGLTLDSNGERA
ncbi:SigE family RNA polymerase sigma factor [Nocardioides caricicola]|uniref:SigE family RNA polymerase sigma factor n=1 Tax=Nocardioides caricicola TaxID=634770 RepID=A0ABW0N7I4_9ACTN